MDGKIQNVEVFFLQLSLIYGVQTSSCTRRGSFLQAGNGNVQGNDISMGYRDFRVIEVRLKEVRLCMIYL